MSEKEEKVIYRCSICDKDVGQVIYNFETKKWECVKCYYKKDEK